MRHLLPLVFVAAFTLATPGADLDRTSSYLSGFASLSRPSTPTVMYRISPEPYVEPELRRHAKAMGLDEKTTIDSTPFAHILRGADARALVGYARTGNYYYAANTEPPTFAPLAPADTLRVTAKATACLLSATGALADQYRLLETRVLVATGPDDVGARLWGREYTFRRVVDGRLGRENVASVTVALTADAQVYTLEVRNPSLVPEPMTCPRTANDVDTCLTRYAARLVGTPTGADRLVGVLSVEALCPIRSYVKRTVRNTAYLVPSVSVPVRLVLDDGQAKDDIVDFVLEGALADQFGM